LVLAAVGLTAAGCLGGSTKTVTVGRAHTVTNTETVTTTGTATSTKPCIGTQLAATFTVIPNSAGAGQIAYALNVRNSSDRWCSMRGLPDGTLLDANGTRLPTRIKAAGDHGKQIVLPPGASATARARFSPDVASDGDSQSGACQPQASTFELVTPGSGGVTEAPIKPPTSVCQQGTLHFEPFDYAD
jgi:hypothetical protein